MSGEMAHEVPGPSWAHILSDYNQTMESDQVIRELRARLELDSGYLSRLIQALTGKGLVVLRPGEGDERVKRAELTLAGRAELDEMDRRSDDAARTILAPLSADQRERLAGAMAEVQRLLRASGVA